MTTHSAVSPPLIEGLRFKRPIGAGGYADVFLYEQEMPRRQVAVKVLRGDLRGSLGRRFASEANTMAGLADHPNIVSVLSADIASDGRPYLVMTFFARENLAVRATRERFGVAEVLRIGVQIASAVETAHRAGILHRDIKPANILTSQFDQVGLTDFGIAANLADGDDDETGVSVPWAAPEVLYATGPAGVASDVYSLGATLWHLLVGRSPFEIPGGDNAPLPMMRRIKDSPVPPTGRADVPGTLERLLAQTMAKDPASRPPSALDLARSLQAVEQELRLPRTEIVLSSDDVAEARDSDPDGHRTQVRSPAAAPSPVPADPPPTPSAPEGHDDGFATRLRPVVVTPEPAAHAPAAPEPARVGSHTVRRSPNPPTLNEPDAAVVTVAEPSTRRMRIIAGAVAAVVLIAAAAAAVSIGPGDDSSRPSPSRSSATTPTPPPGPPRVEGARVDPGNVRFAWKYSNAFDSDTYRWQVVGGGRQGTSTEPEVIIASPAGVKICVEVQVFRASGSDAPLEWSPAGCVDS